MKARALVCLLFASLLAAHSRGTPVSRKRSAGGQRFIVVYRLRDGCHACKTLGYARVGFDLDAGGKFLGTRVVDVRTRQR